MAVYRRGFFNRRLPNGLLSAIVVLAIIIWAYMLYRMVSHSPSLSRDPATRCAHTARVMWASRVVLRSGIVPAAIHINADGHFAAVWPATKEEAEAFAEVRSLPLEAWQQSEVISPGLVDAAAHLAEWLEPPGRSYEGFSSGTQAAAAGGLTSVINLPAHAHTCMHMHACTCTHAHARMHMHVHACRCRCTHAHV